MHVAEEWIAVDCNQKFCNKDFQWVSVKNLRINDILLVDDDVIGVIENIKFKEKIFSNP